MIQKDQLVKIADYLWEIPQTYRKEMRVPAHIFALEEMLDSVMDDRSLNQLVNVTTLPGIVKASIVMPDVHEGYGFPIGGVAATRHPDGVISPGGIGYDINCGVRLLRSNRTFQYIENRLDVLAKELYAQIPSGMGKGGSIKLNINEINNVLLKGAEWAVANGYGKEEDLEYMESHGRLDAADVSCVSLKAKQRGHDQLGTIGSGNHFVEVDRVDEIYDHEAAEAFGLYKDQIVILIHTGSRGLGHQVATDHIRIMMNVMKDYGIPTSRSRVVLCSLQFQRGPELFQSYVCCCKFCLV